ncbi:hypothetical protein WJX79_001911 [Trebouxia sp. C0005]
MEFIVVSETQASGQIKNQEVYIVGEVEGFQSRNRNIKLALVDVAAEYTDLPDVDFVVGTYDWTATEVQPALGFEEGGPVLSQAKKAEHTNAVLYPDHTFTDWQEADTTSWRREQYMMHRFLCIKSGRLFNSHIVVPIETQFLHSYQFTPVQRFINYT